MIVAVADTSPLNYLVQIKCQPLLPALYEGCLRACRGRERARSPGTPAILRAWLRQIPDWISVREGQSALDPVLGRLGRGEREAIQLALEQRAGLVLMDMDAAVADLRALRYGRSSRALRW